MRAFSATFRNYTPRQMRARVWIARSPATGFRLSMLFKLTTQEKKAVALVTLLIVLGIAGYWLL